MPKRKIAYKYKIDKTLKIYGYCDWDNKEIVINPAKGGLIDTIIHEELHRKHPYWSERKVIAKTKKIESRMSVKQARDLLNDLLEKLKAK